MASRVTWWTRAQAHLAADPVLAAVLRSYPDEGIAEPGDLMRCFVSVVTAQQVSTRVGDALAQRVFAETGDIAGHALAQALIDTDEVALRGMGLSRTKAQALKGLAARYADGFVAETALEALSDAAVTERLVSIKGIGPWSANMVLLFGLARPDVFAASDYGIRKAMALHYGENCDIEATSERWRPYRSAATWLLWRTLTQTPVQY